MYKEMHEDLKIQTSKSKIRYERKCKKMAALLAVTKLNEIDRIKEAAMTTSAIENSQTERSCKRICVDSILNFAEQVNRDLHREDCCSQGDNTFEKNLKMKKPKLRLTEVGLSASLDVKTEDRMPIFLSDIQHLLLYSQLGNYSPYAASRWCRLDKHNELVHTIILVIENISLYHYHSYESCFPYLTAKFSHKLELLTPGAYKADIVQDLATLPLTIPQVMKLLSEYGSLEKAALQSPNLFDRIKGLFPVDSETGTCQSSPLPANDRFPRTQLLLSGWQMVEENYPLPIKGLMEKKYTGYVLTKDSYKNVTPFSPMFGIDCEMCLTTTDLELTRVSIVDESGEIIYEELVKPKAAIINYLTEFSGITAKIMKGISKKLEDVQDDLRTILPADAILVGQSLSNDLHALKMMHPYVIDTSIIYNTTGDRNRKTKLQVLAQQFLKTKIQTNRKGHCSVEDSLASLNLAKHKLKHNISYGDAVMTNVARQSKHYANLKNSNYATSLLQEITRMEKTALVVSLDDVIARYCHYTYKDTKSTSRKISCISETSNELVVKRLCESRGYYSFNIAHLGVTDTELENEASTFTEINQWIQKIDESISTPALYLVVFGGQKESGNGCCFISLKKCP